MKAMTMGVEMPQIGKPEGKFLVTPDTQGGWGGAEEVTLSLGRQR